MAEGEDQRISADEIRATLEALRSGEEPALRNVLKLVAAGCDDETLYLPAAVQDAAMAKWQTDRDFFNGGMDQFVWNNGAGQARWVAGAFRTVGAIENADLIDRLAVGLESYLGKVKPEFLRENSVRCFLEYRKQVEGPDFDCPDPGEEVGVALIEYLVAHREELVDPATIRDADQ